WYTVVATDAFYISAHSGKRSDNSSHRPLLNGFVPGQSTLKILACQDTAEETDSCAAVACVQNIRRSSKAVESFSMDKDFTRFFLDFNSHFLKTVYSGKTVRAFQKISNTGGTLGKSAQHYTAMGDG